MADEPSDGWPIAAGSAWGTRRTRCSVTRGAGTRWRASARSPPASSRSATRTDRVAGVVHVGRPGRLRGRTRRSGWSGSVGGAGRRWWWSPRPPPGPCSAGARCAGRRRPSPVSWPPATWLRRGSRCATWSAGTPAELGPDEIARATVESVAENTSDAVVAPLLWGAVAGVPGLLGYRAVNTLDAMIGHRSPRYERFGWAAARLDDLANWVPARVAGLAAAVAAPLVGGSPAVALRAVRRDAGQHPSPNAGVVEAAFAGALGRPARRPQRVRRAGSRSAACWATAAPSSRRRHRPGQPAGRDRLGYLPCPRPPPRLPPPRQTPVTDPRPRRNRRGPGAGGGAGSRGPGRADLARRAGARPGAAAGPGPGRRVRRGGRPGRVPARRRSHGGGRRDPPVRRPDQRERRRRGRPGRGAAAPAGATRLGRPSERGRVDLGRRRRGGPGRGGRVRASVPDHRPPVAGDLPALGRPGRAGPGRRPARVRAAGALDADHRPRSVRAMPTNAG